MADPADKLHALRWLEKASQAPDSFRYPRPDHDIFTQTTLGFEHLSSVLNLGNPAYLKLQQNSKYPAIVEEVIQTFCKNPSTELKLFQSLLPLLRQGAISMHLVYEQTWSAFEPAVFPRIIGTDYLPTETRNAGIPHNVVNSS